MAESSTIQQRQNAFSGIKTGKLLDTMFEIEEYEVPLAIADPSGRLKKTMRRYVILPQYIDQIAFLAQTKPVVEQKKDGKLGAAGGKITTYRARGGIIGQEIVIHEITNNISLLHNKYLKQDIRSASMEADLRKNAKGVIRPYLIIRYNSGVLDQPSGLSEIDVHDCGAVNTLVRWTIDFIRSAHKLVNTLNPTNSLEKCQLNSNADHLVHRLLQLYPDGVIEHFQFLLYLSIVQIGTNNFRGSTQHDERMLRYLLSTNCKNMSNISLALKSGCVRMAGLAKDVNTGKYSGNPQYSVRMIFDKNTRQSLRAAPCTGGLQTIQLPNVRQFIKTTTWSIPAFVRLPGGNVVRRDVAAHVNLLQNIQADDDLETMSIVTNNRLHTKVIKADMKSLEQQVSLSTRYEPLKLDANEPEEQLKKPSTSNTSKNISDIDRLIDGYEDIPIVTACEKLRNKLLDQITVVTLKAPMTAGSQKTTLVLDMIKNLDMSVEDHKVIIDYILLPQIMRSLGLLESDTYDHAVVGHVSTLGVIILLASSTFNGWSNLQGKPSLMKVVISRCYQLFLRQRKISISDLLTFT